MKLLIIATLIALSTATRINSANTNGHQSFNQFVQLMQDSGTCGFDGMDVSMCGCQSQGCAFNNGENKCVPIKGQDNPDVWSAKILAGCNEAASQQACLNHAAWTNRYGGKTDCAWCSGICVKAGNADDSCTKGTGIEIYTGSWPPAPTVILPSPPPPPVVPLPPVVIQVMNTTCEDFGRCMTESAFSAVLRWDNCNDLDIHLTTPAGETVYYGNRGSSDGATLDIDAQASALWNDCAVTNPVEQIRWPDDNVPPVAGIYTIRVHFYAPHQDDPLTQYTLVIWDGEDHHVQQNDPAAFSSGDSQYYYVLVTENRHVCFSLDQATLEQPGYTC